MSERKCMIGDGHPSGAPHPCSGNVSELQRPPTVEPVAPALPGPGPESPSRRVFPSGANRDLDDTKLDYEGFLSPSVLEEFAKYMHGHRKLKDGSLRDSDNWQKGFPDGVAEKSLIRHVMDFWIMHREGVDRYVRPDGEAVTILETLMGILFNVQAITLQRIKHGESIQA